MSSSLYRLGNFCAAHAKRVLAAWLFLIAFLGVVVAQTGINLSSSYKIDGLESIEGVDVLSERLPQASGVSESVLFSSDDSIKSHKETIKAFVDEAKKIGGVTNVSDPFAAATGSVSSDGKHALAAVQTDKSAGDAKGDVGPKAAAISAKLNSLVAQARAADASLTVQRSGAVGHKTEIALSATEIVGVLIAAIVLFVTFGSLLAAGSPIVSAIIGVGTGLLGIVVAASFVEVSSVTPVLAVMIGLAVGIDYALFIMSRAREYLAEGIDPRSAASRATATAGSAVVFAGGTVIVALCGLSVTGLHFLAVMGAASAAVVAVAVLVAVTAVPALLGLLGRRLSPKPRKERRSGRIARAWVRAVTRRPAATVAVVLGTLGVAAVPALDLATALPDSGQAARGTVERDTYDAVAKAYGEGYNAPIAVLADIVQSQDPIGLVKTLSEKIGKLDGVERVALATPNRDGSLAFVQIIPTGGQTSKATADLVKEIRGLAPSWEKQYGISNVMVTGKTAVAIDISDKLGQALLPFGIVVVGLSLAILLVVFRSIAVPLTATLGFLLSLAAGMGAVGAVYGYGWLADALNVTKTGPVISFMPILVIGILFGLAMDYQVFLVSRMREEWIRTGDAGLATREGFVGSAKVVTAAAVIMTGVFAAFIPHGSVEIKPIAIALTAGIAADAFLVRMTFIPAIMALLGKKAWWIPRWLDAALPAVDVEGDGLARSLEHEAWVADHGESAVRLEGLTILDGDEPLVDSFSLTAGPGQLAVVRGEDAVARRALSAVVEGRLLPDAGIAVIGSHTLPDGRSQVQGMTTALRSWDGPVSARASVVVVDDPGKRRWERVRQLLNQGRTVLATGPASMTVPPDLRVSAQATILPPSNRVDASPSNRVGAAIR